MDYNFTEIEQKWQAYWEKNKTFKTVLDKSKPKFYALDMFPYPSGAGLHVGHPEGQHSRQQRQLQHHGLLQDLLCCSLLQLHRGQDFVQVQVLRRPEHLNSAD